MPNIRAAKSGLLLSSDNWLENSHNNSNNDDDDDDAYRYGRSTIMDPDYDKPLCPRFRESIPVCEADCSRSYRYEDGCSRSGESLDCECDGLNSSGGSCSPLMVNVSCRAVARPSDCGLGYQYQIIDIKTFPETGLLCCPPDSSPCPLDLDPLPTNEEEESTDYLPNYSGSSMSRTDSYSRNTTDSYPRNMLSSQQTSRPSLRRRQSSGSTPLSKSNEPSQSTQLSSSSRTRSSYTRSSNTPSRSRTMSTDPTESHTQSSGSTKSRESSGSFTREESAGIELDELNENENNIGSEAETGDSESVNNRETEIAYDGYSDVDENDLPADNYSSQDVKSTVLDSLQSQLLSRSRSTKSQSGSQSFSKSSKGSNSFQLNRASSRTEIGIDRLSRVQPSELNEVVLNKMDYHATSSFPRLKSQGNRRSSSMSATAGSSSSFDRHQAKMMKFLRNLYCQRELTDICIQVGCSCFNAHRVVLACYSKYFACRLIQKSCCPLKNTIVLENNISAKSFSAVLDFMYTGECQIDRGNLAKMFTAADFLEINSLKVHCERLLSSGFKEGSVSSKSQQLEKQWQQVARNFRMITRTDQFLNLSSDCIQKLLCRDDLAVDSEMDVAKAAVRWLNFDREKRKRFTRSIMSSIRFKDLGPEELVRLTSTHQSLLADNSIKEAILEANWYHTCQQRENACAN